MHGTGLALERARMDARHSSGLTGPGRTPGVRALQRLWVFVFVSLAWVFFRAESLANAFTVLWRLVAGLGSVGTLVTLPVVGLCVLGIAIQYVPRRAIDGVEAGFSRVGWAGQGLHPQLPRGAARRRLYSRRFALRAGRAAMAWRPDVPR